MRRLLRGRAHHELLRRDPDHLDPLLILEALGARCAGVTSAGRSAFVASCVARLFFDPICTKCKGGDNNESTRDQRPSTPGRFPLIRKTRLRLGLHASRSWRWLRYEGRRNSFLRLRLVALAFFLSPRLSFFQSLSRLSFEPLLFFCQPARFSVVLQSLLFRFFPGLFFCAMRSFLLLSSGLRFLQATSFSSLFFLHGAPQCRSRVSRRGWPLALADCHRFRDDI